MSSVALSMQNIDRSILDKTTVTDSLKAFGMDPLWMDGDGNFYGERFYDIKNRLDGQTSVGEWELFNLNIFTLNNLLTIISDAASKTGMQVITDALADVNTKVSGTSNVSSYSAASLTTAQQASIKQAATQALTDAVAEVITGQTSFDGFRLGTTVSNFGPKLKMSGDDLLIAADVNQTIEGNNESVTSVLSTDYFNLPLVLRFGISDEIKIDRLLKILWSLDAVSPNDNSNYINAGMVLVNTSTF